MNNDERPIANSLVVLREEFDDWAVLFDPDSGNAFGLSPTGVYLWKLLDGKHSIDEMLKALRRDGEDVPQEAGGHLAAFVEELTAYGLAGYDVEPAHDDKGRIPLCPICISEKVADAIQFAYELPKLINFSGERAAGACCSSGTTPGISTCCTGDCVYDPDCRDGGCANQYCSTGSSAGNKCMTGNIASYQCFCGDSISNPLGWCGGGSCDGMNCGGGASHV